MDKMNVISITSDLDALNKDMQDWSFLPMELKMRSNDECIRQYGMTVPSLYNKLRLDILKSEDKDIPSNIKTLRNDSQVELESSFDEPDLTDGSNFIDVDFNFGDIEKSRQLQQNSLIVIIDPTDNEETVAFKIQSYNALTEKFKRLSDSYSFELYGFNVRNMYKMVMSGIWTAYADEEEERNTILVVGESTEPLSHVENFESVLIGEEDFYNEALLNGDILSLCKYWSECSNTKGMVNFCIESRYHHSADPLAVPSTALPWYTLREQFAMGITPNIDPDKNYLTQIKEAMVEYKKNPSEENANRLLELGWNYEVDITPDSIAVAKENYLQEMNTVYMYDIRSFNEYDIVDRQEGDPVPIYFIKYDDGCIRLSLESDLLRTISPAGSRDANVAGPASVYVVFVKSLDDLDFEKFKSYKTLEIYDELLKADYNKETASKIIATLVQLSTKPMKNLPHYNVYKVYEGNMSDYDYQRTDHIVDTLLHHVDELFKENNITEVDYCKFTLEPTPI